MEASWTIKPTPAIPTPGPTRIPTRKPTVYHNPAIAPTWAPTMVRSSRAVSAAQSAKIKQLEAEERALEKQTGGLSHKKQNSHFNKQELKALEKEIHDLEFGVCLIMHMGPFRKNK
jgi:hypothetical protein